MRIQRRQFLQLAAGAAALPALPQVARAQAYPNRLVRLIVPFTAGGSGDNLARPLANRLSEVWGQQVVIENRGGVGGNLGGQTVAQSAPDGHTLLLGSAFLSINPHLYKNSGYDPVADLAPVTLLCIIPNLMIVPNSLPVKTVKEFIAYARANPGKTTFGSSGVGASPHLTGELFKRMAGIEMQHIPYRGANPAMNDLIPGRIDTMFTNITGVLPQVRSGTVRGVAVSSAQRSPLASDLPTIAESGIPGFEVTTWWGLFVRAGTPAEVVQKIRDDTAAALQHPAVKERYEAVGAPPQSSTPAELAAFLKADLQKWGPIIKDSGIQVN
jgi:tripartite-type tricarboxylate transporter receptor subunit TctC